MEPTSSSVNDSLFVSPTSAAVDTSPLPIGFACETTRDALLPTLTLMHGIAEKRSSLPMLTHVYLEARTDGTLALRATDLEVELQRACQAIVQEPGACTADAQRVYDIMRALPPGALRLSATDQGLTVTQDRRRFRLPTLDPNEFPQLLPVATPSQTLVLRRQPVLEMIDRTIFADMPAGTTGGITGILWEPGDLERLRLVASDGRRLAVAEQCMPGLPRGLRSFSMPRAGLAEMQRLLTRTAEETVTLALTPSVVTLTVVPTTLSVRVLESTFPDYRQVIPTHPSACMTCTPADVLGAVRRLAVLTTDRARGLTWALTPGRLDLTVQTPEFGEGQEEVLVTYDGPALTFGIDVRFVLDFLHAVDSVAQIRLSLTSAETPLLFDVPTDPSYQYVVMPMRLY
jgi:DNA polymerase III subunit beta